MQSKLSYNPGLQLKTNFIIDLTAEWSWGIFNFHKALGYVNKMFVLSYYCSRSKYIFSLIWHETFDKQQILVKSWKRNSGIF